MFLLAFAPDAGYTHSAMESLHELEEKGDYPDLIKKVRERTTEDAKAFRDPSIKAWIGRRWRNLFIQEAMRDEKALRAASTGLRFLLGDKRPPARKIAERFLAAPYNREWSVKMPPAEYSGAGDVTLLFCPGLLTGILPIRAFRDTFPRVEQETGIKILRADSHPVRGNVANMDDLRRALETGEGRDARGESIEQARPPGDVLVFCYSKGIGDMLTLLAEHPELAGRIRALVSWAGAVGGSQVADDLHAKVRNLDLKTVMRGLDRVLKKILPRRVRLKGLLSGTLARLDEFAPVDALRDLTTTRNRAFLDSNKTRLEGLNIPIFFAAGSTRALEVPLSQLSGYRLLKKFDRANDMQVTMSAASIALPMAADLGLLRGHHWDLAYPSFVKRRFLNNLRHDFPRDAAIIALVKLCGELGLLD